MELNLKQIFLGNSTTCFLWASVFFLVKLTWSHNFLNFSAAA